MYPASEIKKRSFKPSAVKEFKLTSGFARPRVKSVQLNKINLDEKGKQLIKDHLGFPVDVLDLKDINNPKGPYSLKFGISPFAVKKVEISPYSCLCGELTGEIEQGKICEICGNKVTSIPDLRKTGVTKVPEYIISPAVFADFEGLIGGTEFAKIIKFDEHYNVNGKTEPKKGAKKYHGMGIREFVKDYKEVCKYYLKKRKDKKHSYDEIMRNKSSLFTKTILSYSALLRPNIENRSNDNINHNRKLFESNKNYETIMKSIDDLNSIKELSGMDRIKESFLFDIQLAYNDIVEYLIKEWKGKKGLFRGSATSTQVDYSARMVITPDNTLRVNEVSLPYVVCLVFFDLKIISILQEIDGITFSEAQTILSKAMVTYDKRIKMIIDHILSNSEVDPRVLVNRAPSLNPESIRLCKIICKDNIDDLTMGIPTATLSGFAGDYDGDSLLTIMIHFKSLIDAFSALDPCHQFISRMDGQYSNDYLFIKDFAVGVTMFYENSKGDDYYRLYPEELYREDV